MGDDQALRLRRPSRYVGVRHLDRNIHQYEATVTITAPSTVIMGDIQVTTSSHTFFGACELAAQAALGRFCNRHQVMLHHTPVALYPPTGDRIPIWQSRVDRARNTDSPLYDPVIAALLDYAIASSRMQDNLQGQLNTLGN